MVIIHDNILIDFRKGFFSPSDFFFKKSLGFREPYREIWTSELANQIIGNQLWTTRRTLTYI